MSEAASYEHTPEIKSAEDQGLFDVPTQPDEAVAQKAEVAPVDDRKLKIVDVVKGALRKRGLVVVESGETSMEADRGLITGRTHEEIIHRYDLHHARRRERAHKPRLI